MALIQYNNCFKTQYKFISKCISIAPLLNTMVASFSLHLNQWKLFVWHN